MAPNKKRVLRCRVAGIGWDVFCWIGQRRFSRHWSVPQIRSELNDSYQIQLSDDAIEDHIAAYQNMVAARHVDSQLLTDLYRDRDTNAVVLTIDGLQPEKGHETLYVVREVTENRVFRSVVGDVGLEFRILIFPAVERAIEKKSVHTN